MKPSRQQVVNCLGPPRDHTPPGVLTLDLQLLSIATIKNMGVGIRGTLGDIDPLNIVPFKRAIRRVEKGPFSGVSLIPPRKTSTKTEATVALNP